MRRYTFWLLWWLCVLALWLCAGPGWSQQPGPATSSASLPPGLTTEQKAKYPEWQQHVREAVQLRRSGPPDRAIAAWERLLDFEKKFWGPAHKEVADTLNDLALLHVASGNLAAALKVRQERLAVQIQLHGEKNWRVADARWAVADLLRQQQLTREQRLQLAEAYQKLHAAEEIYQKGELAEAARLVAEGLTLRRAVLGDRHPKTATALNNLGLVKHNQGDLVEAQRCHQQVLEIYRAILGEQHPDTADSLTNLGVVLRDLGDLPGAQRCHQQALEIRQATLGEQHPSTAHSLSNLGVLLYEQGDLAGAQRCHQQAFDAHMAALGDRHPHTATLLHNRGIVLQEQGDLPGARRCHEQALDLCKKVLGEQHPETAQSLSSLAAVLYQQGDLKEARQCQEQTLRIYKAVLGEQHPDTAQALSNLGVLLRHLGDRPLARAHYEQALSITRRHLELTALCQAERLQLALAGGRRYQLDNLLSLAVEDQLPGSVGYAEVLAWKGATLARQRRLRALRSEPPLASIAAKLQATATQLANLSFATPAPDRRAAWLKELERLTGLKEEQEAELAQGSPDYRRQLEQDRLTPTQLLQCLPKDVALVDFLVYWQYPAWRKEGPRPRAEQRLLAFVLRQGQDIVRLDLGPMRPLGTTVERWRSQIRGSSHPGANDPGQVLYRQIWKPLIPYLQNASVVLLAPDGPLCQLPFAALPGSKANTYLLEEVALATVAVPQLLPELLRPAIPAVPQPSLLLVGGVDFNAAPGLDSAGRGRTTARMGHRHWNFLPGTVREIETLEQLFRQRHGPKATLTILRGQEASEGAFRRKGPGQSVLHLATHGYFADPTFISALSGKEDRCGALFGAEQPRITGYHPGLLSGLALAGANCQPEADQDDGILTALEVAELDLRQAELVVLSACETGLGETAGGEGLLGLQRAFQVAGAHSVIATQWSVPDEATQMLMTRFYTNLWEKKMSRLKALREAQRWMLVERHQLAGLRRGLLTQEGVALTALTLGQSLSGSPGLLSLGVVLPAAEVVGIRGMIFHHPVEVANDGRLPPYYWAAFVLSGDWR